MISRISIILVSVAVFSVSVSAMPVEQTVGGRVPHPNSAAGQALANKDLSGSGQLVGGGVPHPNSAAGQALTNKDLSGSEQLIGGNVPHPNSAAGQALSAAGEEKSVLEGGTQVKPWLKNQPDLSKFQPPQ